MKKQSEDETSQREVMRGPWHFVSVTIERDEIWCINGAPVRVTNGNVAGFLLTDDAMHYVSTGRALDLGVWDNLEELDAEIARMTKATKKKARA